MNNFKDLSGQQFTYLTVLNRDYNPNHKRVMWKCVCKCGNVVVVAGNDLKRKYGGTRSCGCRKHETQNVKHGMRHTRIYAIWSGICKRCYNSHAKEYKNYGGRGISMCDEWKQDFVPFYTWATDNGYSDELTIDRIDNNGNYSPDNCRWVTNREQANNRRTTLYIEHNGAIKSFADWCRLMNVEYKPTYQRYRRAMLKNGKASFEDVFLEA